MNHSLSGQDELGFGEVRLAKGWAGLIAWADGAVGICTYGCLCVCMCVCGRQPSF